MQSIRWVYGLPFYTSSRLIRLRDPSSNHKFRISALNEIRLALKLFSRSSPHIISWTLNNDTLDNNLCGVADDSLSRKTVICSTIKLYWKWKRCEAENSLFSWSRTSEFADGNSLWIAITFDGLSVDFCLMKVCFEMQNFCSNQSER